MRCVNVHVCQSCFLSDKHTRKHKLHHPVLEFCTQVSPPLLGELGGRQVDWCCLASSSSSSQDWLELKN